MSPPELGSLEEVNHDRFLHKRTNPGDDGDVQLGVDVQEKLATKFRRQDEPSERKASSEDASSSGLLSMRYRFIVEKY